MLQHKAARPSRPATTSLRRHRGTSSACATVLGASILRLRQSGRLNRALHPIIEAMTLFVSFVEKRLRLSRIDDINADHIREFVQLPLIRKSDGLRSIEEVRRARKDGALLFLSLMADGKIDPRKETR